MHIGRDNNRQQRILQRVALEDVREGSADHGAESELGECPRSMLAGTAAAEVVAGQQNLDTQRPRLIQDEIRLRISFRIVAPVVEKLLVQPFLGDRFQEPRRDDLIGVDVVDRERQKAAFELREFLHWSNVLTSVTTPVMALAAAVRGLARNVRPPFPCRPSKLRLLVETLYSPGFN